MLLAKYDDMVKAVPSDRADQPFTISVLPWRSRRGWTIPNAHRPKSPDDDIAIRGGLAANRGGLERLRLPGGWPLLYRFVHR
jgi:hypothetical protein